LPFIVELSHRQVVKPPALRPRYLEMPDALRKLERLRSGMKVLELLQK
jgi:hypothetical protein